MNSIILAIETSTPQGSVALMKEGQLVFEKSFRSERNHNSHLFPALEETMQHLDSHSLDLILTGTGPGSYNGSRVAIASAQGIGTVHGCSTVGISSFLGLPSVHTEQDIAICGDARRQEFYIQRAGNGQLKEDIRLFSPEAFVEEISTCAAELVTADDPERLKIGPSAKVFRPETPEAGKLILAWNSMCSNTQNTLYSKAPEPAYLRPPHITKAKPRKITRG